MDEAQVRNHLNQHADAVVRRDMDAIVADFSEDLRPGVPQLQAGVQRSGPVGDIAENRLEAPMLARSRSSIARGAAAGSSMK
jgi:hypothetical protein